MVKVVCVTERLRVRNRSDAKTSEHRVQLCMQYQWRYGYTDGLINCLHTQHNLNQQNSHVAIRILFTRYLLSASKTSSQSLSSFHKQYSHASSTSRKLHKIHACGAPRCLAVLSTMPSPCALCSRDIRCDFTFIGSTHSRYFFALQPTLGSPSCNESLVSCPRPCYQPPDHSNDAATIAGRNSNQMTAQELF